MEHRGFFHRSGPFSIAQISEHAGARPAEGSDLGKLLTDIRTLGDARRDELTFLDNRKYLKMLADTRAGACFLSPRFEDKLPSGTIGLFTDEPYRAFARALALFYPGAGRPVIAAGSTTPIHSDAQIEEGAVIEPGAIVGPHAQIGAHTVIAAGAVIGPHAQIGAHTVIAAGAVIGFAVTIGRDGYIGPNANITHALIGDRVIIHAGVSIGQDGFGFAMGPDGHLKVPQIGRVIIQNDVEIGANSTVDRGALSDTVIGEGTKIDNLVQIGHNVVIGRHCVLAGQAGISGSTVLEDFVVMGGQSGCVGHIRIGAGAQIAGNAGLTRSVPPGQRWGGAPAQPIEKFSREIAVVKSLSEMLKGKTLARLKRLLG